MSKKRIVLIVHADLDGVVCALVGRKFFGRDNVQVHFCDYSNIDETVLRELGKFTNHSIDLLWTADIAPKENVLKEIDMLHCSAASSGMRYDRCGVGVFISDHHDQTRPLSENRNYFFHTEDSRRFSGADVFTLALTSMPQQPEDLNCYYGLLAPNRAWDCWHVEGLGSEWRRSGTILNELFKFFGRDLFIELMEDWADRGSLPCTPVDMEDAILAKLPISGEDVIEALERQRDRGVFSRVKSAIMKTDPEGNSFVLTFGDRWASEICHAALKEFPEAQYAMVVNLTRQTAELRSRRGEFDVGALAKRLGGGGRAETAGFPLHQDNGLSLVEITMTNMVQFMWLLLTESE